MNDEELNALYADPENRTPQSPARRRANKPKSAYVPIRFQPELIADVKALAEEEGKTVSSWIREIIEREVERRRPRYPRTEGLVAAVHIDGFDADLTGRTATDYGLAHSLR
jgi:hypothetical protein